MGAPGHAGRLRVIVVRVVVLRHGDGEPLRLVPQVFLLQRARIVFRMAGDEDLAAAVGGDGMTRSVREAVRTSVSYRLWQKDRLLLALDAADASFEQA